MSEPESQILTVCPQADRAEIAAILSQGGYGEPIHATSESAALERFISTHPDVVIVYASLEKGDARTLTAALRAHRHRSKLILVGDTDGPVRNALDAAEFSVDRFLARPLAAKALLFAVRTCLDAVHRARQKEASTRDSQLERKMASVMDRAIDDFVRTAMEALPEQGGPPAPFPRATSSPDIELPPIPTDDPSTPVPVPPPRALSQTTAGSDGRSPSPRSKKSAAKKKGSVARSRNRRLRSTVIAVPPPPVVELEPGEEDADPSGDGNPAATSGDAPPSGRPSLTGALADIALQQATGDELPIPEPAPVAAPSENKTTLLGTAVTDADAPPTRPGSGAFARQLRRKMSDMAARLFPSKEGPPQVDVGVAQSHSTEIDLSSFGVDTVIEEASELAADDDDDEPVPTAEESPTGESAKPSALAGPPTPVVEEPESPPEPESHTAELPAPPPPAPVATNLAAASASAPIARKPSPTATRPAQTSSTTRPRRDTAPGPFGAPGDPDHQRGHTVIVAAGEDLDTDGPLRRGESDAALLIEHMYRQRFTGKVILSKGDAEKEIIFDKGRLVFATSNLSHDRMGEQLFREGKITEGQLEQVRDIVKKSGRRMGEVLIEKGWLKRRELLPVVRRHIEDLVYSLFAWDEGRYRVEPGEFAAGERIRISRHPAAMILEGIRRKYDTDSLQALMGGPESIVEIVDDRKLKSVMSVADLSSAERKVLTRFDGERSMTRVQKDTGVQLTDVYQLAYGLVVWGAAQSLRRGADGRPMTTEEPALVGETDLAIDRRRVEAKYSLVLESDYFTLLGVRRDATSFEVKRAYESARRDFAKEGFPVEIRGELSERIDEINEVLEEAYLILRDDALRSSYLTHLRD